MARISKRWPIYFLAICALLPLCRAIFNGETVGPFDEIRHMAPWNGPRPDRPIDLLQADGVLQFYNWRDMVFESWGKQQLPAWNPYELAGTPLLANSQSAPLYPPHILVGLLHFPTGLGIDFLAWIHLFWAGLGVYLLTRKLGGERTGATVAGTAFLLSPFMLGWTALASVITTVSWIPWILALIVAVFSEPASLRKLMQLNASLAVCTAMMILGGHLQFCAYGFMAAAFLVLWLGNEGVVKMPEARKATVGRVACAAIGIVLGAMLASPQLLPALNYAKFSHRANVASDQGYADYVKGAIPAFALQGIAFPTALGDPTLPFQGTPFKGENGYWPTLTSPGLNFAETALSVGPVIFLLLCFVRRPKRGAAAMIGIGILALLIALGTALNWPLYFLVPGWSASGSPGRICVLFVLSACVLGGLGVENLRQGDTNKLRIVPIIAGLVALLAALAPVTFGLSYPNPFKFPADGFSALIKTTVSAQLPIFLIALVIGLAAVLAAQSKAKYAVALPAAAALCSLVSIGWNLVPSGKPLAKVPADAHARYAFLNATEGKTNVWPLIGAPPYKALMPPDTASGSRIHEIGGYDSLLHRDSVAMLHAIDGADAAAPANGNMMYSKPSADPKALAEAGVSEVWSLAPEPQFGPGLQADGVNVYTMPGPGRVSCPRGAKITGEDFETLTVDATGPGLLTVRDRMMPGWSVEVDGKPGQIQAVDSPLGKGLWRGVDLPAGAHHVVFSYKPPGYGTGLILLAIAGVVCLGLLLWGRRDVEETGA